MERVVTNFEPRAVTRMTGQELYVKARDEGWEIDYTQRMKGVSLHVRHDGRFAGVFGFGGYDADAHAWEALADAWNNADEQHPFWGPDPDAAASSEEQAP